MHPTLFKLGPLSIHSFGVMIAIGFIFLLLTASLLARKEGLDQQNIFDLGIIIILAAIFGARLFYVIGQWNYFSQNWLDIFMVQNGGFVFLGGLFACLLAIFIYARLQAIPLLPLFDVLTPATILAYAIGRIGCFLNGCCFGLPTQCPLGVVFPSDSLAGYYYPGLKLHPTQLYSSVLMFIAFIILLAIYRRKSFSGQVFFWGLILYSLYRFALEFLRYSPIHWWGLTPSQWLLIFQLLFGIWGLIYFKPPLKTIRRN